MKINYLDVIFDKILSCFLNLHEVVKSPVVLLSKHGSVKKRSTYNADTKCIVDNIGRKVKFMFPPSIDSF
jgi:hypothetical protein